MIKSLKHDLLLGSASPRRRELLAQVFPNFQVLSSSVEETYPDSLDTELVAGFLSELKWTDLISKTAENTIVLTSDTTVVLDKTVFGKPRDKEEAKSMLKKLSGKTHKVITAFTLGNSTRKATVTDITEVEFKAISEEEIDHYIEEFKPFDKAGAYGIQEWIGWIGIRQIKGSYFSVMGLPIDLVYDELKKWQ